MNLAGLKILVVEDEPIIAMALEEQLEDAGAQPEVAGSIQRAHELLDARSFDAAILDINVHGEKSYSVAQVLAGRAVPFVFASGYGDTLNPAEYANVPTLTKPYDIAAVANALATARGG